MNANAFPTWLLCTKKKIEVLVDRPASHDADEWVARSHAQAPDIDSHVFLKAEGVHAGQLVNVKVTDYQNYDLVAELPKKRSRSLSVIA